MHYFIEWVLCRRLNEYALNWTNMLLNWFNMHSTEWIYINKPECIKLNEYAFD